MLFKLLPFDRRSSVLSTAIVGASLLLGGCASLSPNGGIDSLQQPAQEKLGAQSAPLLTPLRNAADARAVADQIKPLLAQPLSAESAVQIALLNRRALQAELADIGIADAERVQLVRLDNPRFGFKRSGDGEIVSIERTLGVNLIKLFNQPLLKRLGAARFEAARQRVLAEIVNTATDTRLAWVDAVAAEQGLAYATQVREAADAGATLADEMRRAGNWSELEAAREKRFQGEALSQSLRVRQEATSTRERLTRLLGLESAEDFRLPQHLSPLPEMPKPLSTPEDIRALEQRALEQRLDIAAARAQLALTAESLGLSRRTRVVNVLELDLIRENTTGANTTRGVELGIEIPLFDWGEARVAEAEGIYLQEAHRLAQRAIDARSELREKHAAWLNAHALAAHYRDITLPQRKRIADENLLRYNGMLIGVFELLADAREQVAAVNAASDALRDYWCAETQLQHALGGPIDPGRPQASAVNRRADAESTTDRTTTAAPHRQHDTHSSGEHRHE